MSDKKTFKQKSEELQNILDWFNQDDIDIEQAIVKFKEAENLTAQIKADLDNMKNEINIVKKNFGASDN